MNQTPGDTMYDIEREDKKLQSKNTRRKRGYHDWEAGAPQDPNHTGPTQHFSDVRYWRRRVDIYHWHLTALYGSITVLVVIILALITVITIRLHLAVHSSIPGTPLPFDASQHVISTITVCPTIDEPVRVTARMTTRTIDSTYTASASTQTLTVISTRPETTKVVFYTPPPVTMTTWVDATTKQKAGIA